MSHLGWRAGIAGSTLLLSGLAGCADAPHDSVVPPAPTGALRVTVTTTGVEPDLDGYRLTVDSGGVLPLAANDARTFAHIPVGQRQIRLDGLANHCVVDSTVGGGLSRTLHVAANDTIALTYVVRCGVRSLVVLGTGGGTQYGHLYAYLPDAGNVARVRRLTAGDWFEDFPAASPDGKRVVFASTRDGSGDPTKLLDELELYTVDLADLHVTRLTSSPGADLMPAWSPDGARIAFVSRRIGGDNQIYVMNADGSAPRALTATGGDNARPTWSPDSRRLAFVSGRSGTFNVYVMNADGSGTPVMLARGAFPAWSPDGTWIAFNGSETRCPGGILLIRPDGTDERPLTECGGTATYRVGAWSPDGRYLAVLPTDVAGATVRRVDVFDVAGPTPGQRVPLELGLAAISEVTWPSAGAASGAASGR